MARRRDIVIGVVIGLCFIIFLLIMAVGFVGMYDDSEESWFTSGERIAVVEIFGVIDNSADVVKQLKRWGKDESIRAILIHVDSPGGGVAATQEIYDEIIRVRVKDEKMVVVSISSAGLSGGYYISCAADQIVANPGTLVGSIGVILSYPVAESLLTKIGLKLETVKSGEVKDVGSMWREPTQRDRRMLQAAIDDTYEQFVDAVVEGRNLSREDVLSVADGSMFTGRQALDLGLVDKLGSFEEAIRITAELAEIEGEPRTVKEKPKSKITFWDLLEGNVFDVLKSFVPSEGPKVQYLCR
jgi:protease-4